MHDGKQRDVKGDRPIREASWLTLLLPGFSEDSTLMTQERHLWVLPGHSSSASTSSIYKTPHKPGQVWGQSVPSPWALVVSSCSGNLSVDIAHRAGKAKPGEMWMFTAHTGWAGGVAQLFRLSKPSTPSLENWWSPESGSGVGISLFCLFGLPGCNIAQFLLHVWKGESKTQMKDKGEHLWFPVGEYLRPLQTRLPHGLF